MRFTRYQTFNIQYSLLVIVGPTEARATTIDYFDRSLRYNDYVSMYNM